MNRRRILPAACAILVACLAVCFGALAAETGWKQEFERICIQVETAGNLHDEQLQELVKDADRLFERMQSVEDPQIKVYLQRLQRCRDFFSFMREARQRDEARAGAGG